MGSYAESLRPWGSFLAAPRKPTDGRELQRRVEQNLSHFQANYLVLLLFFVVLTLFSHPQRLAATGLVLGAWALYCWAGGLNPNWKPKAGDIEINSSIRL